MEVKDAVRSLRVALGMTQEELAQRREKELTRATVAKIETGANKGTAQGMFGTLATALFLKEEEFQRLVDGALAIDDAIALASARRSAYHSKNSIAYVTWISTDKQRLEEAASAAYSHAEGHRARDLQLVGQQLAATLGRYDLPAHEDELREVARWLLRGASRAREVEDESVASPEASLDTGTVTSLMIATVLAMIRNLSPVVVDDNRAPAAASIVKRARELLSYLEGYYSAKDSKLDIEFLLEDVARWGYCTRDQSDEINKVYELAIQRYADSRNPNSELPF